MDIQYLHECYEVKNGGLYWRWRPAHHYKTQSYADRFNRKFAGKRAGRVNNKNGYRYVTIGGGCESTEHRVVFALHHNREPIAHVDHIDRNRRNNRPENLREVTNMQNHQNMGFYSNNKTGVQGVHFCKTHRKYKAKITVYGKVISLGHYVNFDDAVAARKAGEEKYRSADS